MKRRSPTTSKGPGHARIGRHNRAPLDAVARNTVKRVARALMRAGYPGRELSDQFEREVARAPRMPKFNDRKTQRDFHDVSHVLTLWESDPDCVDETGQPRALPVRGPAPSVEALVKRVRPNLSLEEALDLFSRTRTLRKVGRKLIPADNSVMHSPESKTQSAHHLLVLNQLLRNFEFNSKRGYRGPRWPQRVVECPDFPAGELPALIARFAEAATRIMKSYDHIMARTARRAGPTAPRVRPALNLFLSVDPSARTRPKRAGSPRTG